MRCCRGFFLKFVWLGSCAAGVALGGCGGHTRLHLPASSGRGAILRGDAPTWTVSAPVSPSPSPLAAIPPGEPISLRQLVELAMAQHPELAAAQAQVQAAHGRLLQAGLYPNPTVGWEADELGTRGRGAAAGEQGPVLAQEIVTAGKLELARASASFDVVASDWNVIAQRHAVANRVRNAFYELVTAERELEVLDQIVKITGEDSDDGLLRLAKRIADIEGFKSERLQAEIEYANSLMRREVGVKRREAARRKLAAAVGLDRLPDNPVARPSSLSLPAREWDDLWPRIQQNAADIQKARARVLRAQQEVLRAQAAPIPNLHLKVHPFYAFGEDEFRVMIEGGLPLPLFDRNQGNLFAAQAELTHAHAEVRRVELSLAERLADALERHDAVRRQLQRYRDEILPKAKDSLEVIRGQFRRAKADQVTSLFLSLMEKYRLLTEAQLAEVRLQGELWKAESDILGLLQEEVAAVP